MEDIDTRQSSILLNPLRSAIIIGAGGIGSWMALNLALAYKLEILILIDNDRVEKSNLNRTPFRIFDIGNYKVSALKDIIQERRPNLIIETVIDRLTDDNIKSYFNRMSISDDRIVVIDCRDNYFNSQYEYIVHTLGYKCIKLSYDGLSITVDLHPYNTKVHSTQQNHGYNVIPSFLIPSQFLANMVCNILFINRKLLYDRFPNLTKIENVSSPITLNMATILGDLIQVQKLQEERSKV